MGDRGPAYRRTSRRRKRANRYVGTSQTIAIATHAEVETPCSSTVNPEDERENDTEHDVRVTDFLAPAGPVYAWAGQRPPVRYARHSAVDQVRVSRARATAISSFTGRM